MVYIKQLKVRPVKVAPYVPCKVELAAMMGCWATQGDFASLTKCAEAAQTLHQCMRTAPGWTKRHRPPINYHLARLNKNLR